MAIEEPIVENEKCLPCPSVTFTVVKCRRSSKILDKKSMDRIEKQAFTFNRKTAIDSEAYRVYLKGKYIYHNRLSDKDILKHREGLVTRMFKEVRETVHASMESGIERISNKTNLELAAMGKLMKLERKYKKEGGINFLIKTYNFLVERGDIQRKKVPLAMSDKEAGQQNLENANLTQLDILEAHIDYNRTMDKVYQGAIN